MRGFTNASIAPVNENKPHIVFRSGFWRVSKMPKKFYKWRNPNPFTQAHQFAARLNNVIQMQIYINDPQIVNMKYWTVKHYE